MALSFDEAFDGDLPDDGLNPEAFTLDAGTNTVTANQQGNAAGRDIDYFSITVPEGAQLTAINVASYETGAGNQAFIGLQAGQQVTVDPNDAFASVGDLLGGNVYGTEDVGSDILPAIGTLNGAQGFSGPLPSGDYTFWLNQTDAPSTVSLEFVVETAAVEGSDGDDAFVVVETPPSEPIAGGEGTDTIDFSGLTESIIIDLDVESAGALGAPGGQNGGILAAPPEIDENGVEQGQILQEVNDVENIIGTDFDDLLIGNNESNEIQGGAGNDTLAGVAMDDVIDGGDGIDTAIFTFAPQPIVVDLAIDGPQDIGPPGTDTLIDIENVSGSDFAADTLLGNDADNVLAGLAFDDNLDGRGGNDTLNGGAGSDTLAGGAGNDTLVSDTLDVLDGGEGTDTADFSAADGVFANLTDDTVTTPVTVLNDGATDLSGTGATPTAFGLDIGASRISNQAANAAAVPDLPDQDVDIFTIEVPEGAVLSELVLTQFVSSDNLGFIAVVEGDTFPADALAEETAEPGTFIGLANFGNDAAPNAVTGTNILPALAAGGGLVPPEDFLPFDGDAGLGAGTFTFLVQQLGPATIEYGLDFIVEPLEGSSATLTGIENLTGSASTDVLIGDEAANVLNGSGGADTLDGRAGEDTLSGGGGDDVILSDALDLINGGGGSDTIDFSSAAENATGGAFPGVIIDLDVNSAGPAGEPSENGAILDAPPAAGGVQIGNLQVNNVENVSGSAFNDGLFGNNEVNVLIGLGGDDLVHGFAGDDFLSGSAGVDTVLFAAAQAGVAVNLNDQVAEDVFAAIVDGTLEASFAATGGAGSNVLSGFENVTGGAGDDDITGDDGDNTLNGGAGNDILTGGAGSNVLNGGEGDDTAVFAGNQADFTIETAEDGSLSVVNAATGIDDVLTDIETLSFDDGDVDVDDGDGDDVDDGDGDDADDGAVGAVVIGSAEGDTIAGGQDFAAVADTILTGAGEDAIDLALAGAGAGNNIVLSGSASDEVFASVGDIVLGGSGADTLVASAANGGNRLAGGAGDDTFIVEGSGDRLLGGVGDDTFLLGEASDNTVSGGAGADVFSLTTPGDLPTVANLITDFEADTDLLQTPGFDFADLAFAGSDILVGDDVIATLVGFDAEALTAADFDADAPVPDEPVPDEPVPDEPAPPASGPVAPVDLATLTLGEVVVGPLGPVVESSLEDGLNEPTGIVTSSAFVPAAEGDPFTFVSSVQLTTPGEFESFAIADVPGFTGTAGFAFDDITGLPAVDGLLLGDALTAGGTGTAEDFAVELTEQGALEFTLPEGADFFDGGDVVTFFYQSEFGPVGPNNTANLVVGGVSGFGPAPLAGPDSPAASGLSEPVALL